MAKKESSRKRRRKSDAPMPQSGAGLIRFFEDETSGFKIGPKWTVGLAVILITSVILAHFGIFKFILGLDI